MRYSLHFILLIVSLLVLGCQSNGITTVPTGSLLLTFDNVVGNQDLKLNTNTYQNELGEPFVVTKFNYYVSTIRLKKADGMEYVVLPDDSYFLIQEDKPAS